jgi:hypothetical protein
MAGASLPAEKLREYLGALKPEARALLIAELERGILRGDEMLGGNLVLQELRRTMRDGGPHAPQSKNAARCFFRFLEPFVVDDVPTREHVGRVSRATLDPIWAWIGRDLLSTHIQTFSDQIDQALAAGDSGKAEALARRMQSQAAQAMADAFDRADADSKAARRLAGQITVANGVEAAREVLALLQARDAIADFAAQLPGHVGALTDAQLQPIKTLLDAQLAKDEAIFVYCLVLVMSRLAVPWQLVRLATKAAQSDKAAKVAATPYAPVVGIVLAEIERLVGELKTDLRSGQGVAVIALLKAIHDAVRGLRGELELPSDFPWGRQVAAIRTEISNLLKHEIESAPGRMRRLLRPRPAKEIIAGSALDAGDVAEIEALIDFVNACHKYAGELALNEVTLRSFSELQQHLETGQAALLDALRNAGDSDRRFRQSQIEAAARFGGKVFGPEYAATLTKAIGVALARNAERTAAVRAS